MGKTTRRMEEGGRLVLEGEELREFRRRLIDIEQRCAKIEHDCELLALRGLLDTALARIADLEERKN